MTTFPKSPKLQSGGLVLLNPETGAVERVIALQYNPETLSRTLQVQGVGEGGDRSEALRLKGPPVETVSLEAEIDATDQLEVRESEAVQTGLLSQLAALETVIYPEAAEIQANEQRAASGTLEIVPMQAPLTLFVWSKSRVMPVRITDFQITEEAFDPSLHPIRAKVSLTLRVLSVDDLGFTHKGGSLFLTYHQAKERLAGKAPAAVLGQLGLEGIP